MNVERREEDEGELFPSERFLGRAARVFISGAVQSHLHEYPREF